MVVGLHPLTDLSPLLSSNLSPLSAPLYSPPHPPCYPPTAPAAALVITKSPHPRVGVGWGAQSSCLSEEADTKASRSATTCGFAPSLGPPPTWLPHASSLLSLFPTAPQTSL